MWVPTSFFPQIVLGLPLPSDCRLNVLAWNTGQTHLGSTPQPFCRESEAESLLPNGVCHTHRVFILDLLPFLMRPLDLARGPVGLPLAPREVPGYAPLVGGYVLIMPPLWEDEQRKPLYS